MHGAWAGVLHENSDELQVQQVESGSFGAAATTVSSTSKTYLRLERHLEEEERQKIGPHIAVVENVVLPERDRVARHAGASVFYLCSKRTIDIAGALFGLIVLLPAVVVISLLIRFDSRGPIFHRRRVLERQDYRGDGPARTFDAFKFRTMVPNADAVLQSDPALYREYKKDFKLRNDPRVTRIGASLRRMSLDEVPQLLNVLRGQMSLVGPRMISPPELAMYGARSGKLLSVKPGLTGLWQVSGRQTIGYAERVRLDMWYIDHRSPRLDMEIMLRTIGTVLGRRGAF